MIRLNAYVLAADPTWLEVSVNAYYDRVSRIVVSFDERGRGWTGASIPVEECLARLRSIDRKRKMSFEGGCYSGVAADPMYNDTLQRNAALASASCGADWVLQLDTDEWMPNFDRFHAGIVRADAMGLCGLEWPMRVLYRRVNNRVLEVCSLRGNDHFEYIAPVAVRSGTRLVHSRRAEAPFLRAVATGDSESIQLQHAPASLEVRAELLEAEDAIVHNSWARTPLELRRKLASWSHSSLRAWLYYATRWLPSKWTWRWMCNLHPFFGGVWPALRFCKISLPDEGTAEVRGEGKEAVLRKDSERSVRAAVEQ
jgi:hypothetical protein